MQLYSSVCAHFPAGAPRPAAPAAAFKVPLPPPASGAPQPEPEPREQPPAAPREPAAAAAMPAFAACFEGAPAPAPVSAAPRRPAPQAAVRALGADALLLRGPAPSGPPRRAAPAAAWLLDGLLRPDGPARPSRPPPASDPRLREHRQALATAQRRGPPGSPEPGPSPWGEARPAESGARGRERSADRGVAPGAGEARPASHPEPAAPASSGPAVRGGAAEAGGVPRADPRDEKLALYLAEVEKQDKYLRQRNKFRFHIIPDGNCLYRAVSKAVSGDQSLHRELREQTVHHIADHLDHFGPLIEGDVGEFIVAAAQDGAWAGYPELLAMGQMLNVNIHLTTGGKPESPTVATMTHYLGPEDARRPSIWLSWLSNGHYDAVFDQSYPNPEYDSWCKQTQVQRKRDEELAKSMAISLSKMYIEQNACS
ncbi:OTU domain-containing protein 1 [Choloepus didactylus]|uniref:OTU domain-containing protein 1 n=1 Tax=Choloepus didactylus TaxID=27675 RepID=UPI00189C7BBF|nr:OTU domain-containing protein 1 [Choloepus didactylus]